MASSSRRVREKRSKGANNRIDSIHISWFNDNHPFEDFRRNCKTRTVIVEREFDISLLRKINFRFLDTLIAWNWWRLINMH